MQSYSGNQHSPELRCAKQGSRSVVRPGSDPRPSKGVKSQEHAAHMLCSGAFPTGSSTHLGARAASVPELKEAAVNTPAT